MTAGDAGPVRQLNPPARGSPPGYSQVVEVRATRMIFIAGQTALDRDGALVEVSKLYGPDFRIEIEAIAAA